ncbi:major facilitator superfamily domain-containing protein [Aspergillus pseudotamarii]|uniref:Major facilitator superfamily domain-containing protein n=1 Tax=Aspergillus pseudotamarii TaxID=132259 RepID=A0A5N6TA11_ASPPS|nr:major facilitator superfamily domain-containing protein [Aspergillus pseudotamarii]KAE8143011.1 major facilitator superfamily domain-containing protein [Aspergillus pseudotamarii]
MGVESKDLYHTDNESGSCTYRESSQQCLITNHATDFATATQHTYREDNTRQPEWMPGVREWLVTTCVSILVMMDAFNTTVVIPLMPGFSSIFQQPLENALWINTSYFIGNASGQGLFAMLAEVLGHGPILLSSAVLATTGTGICGGSLSLSVLVAGRFIQGIGGGGVVGVSLLIVADLIPKSHQVQFSTYIFRAQMIGMVIGSVAGGVYHDYTTYIWAFYSSFVFCAMGLLVIPFALDLRGHGQGNKLSATSKFRTMDWIGAMLTLLGMGTLLTGIGWGGTQNAWNNWQTLVPICVGGAFLIVLILHETMWAIQPMFSSRVFRDLSSTMLQTGGFLHGFILSSHLHYLPLYLIFVQSINTTLIGLSLIALTGLTVPALMISGTGQFFRRPHISTWITRIGWLFTTTATGCSILLNVSIPTYGWVIIFLVAGLGSALLTLGYNLCIHVDTMRFYQGQETRESAKVSTTSILIYSILHTWGMCIAIPISGTIIFNYLSSKDMLDLSTGYTGSHSGAYAPQEAKDAFTDALQVLWKGYTAIAALGGISSLFIRSAS